MGSNSNGSLFHVAEKPNEFAPGGFRRVSANPGCPRLCVIDVGEPDASELEKGLPTAGIETRQWWGDGVHAHPSFFRDVQAVDVDRVVRLAGQEVLVVNRETQQ